MNARIQFKIALFRAWRINLFRPELHAPIPGWVLRKMGAE